MSQKPTPDEVLAEWEGNENPPRRGPDFMWKLAEALREALAQRDAIAKGIRDGARQLRDERDLANTALEICSAQLAEALAQRDEHIRRNGLLASNTLDADSQVAALQAQLAEAQAKLASVVKALRNIAGHMQYPRYLARAALATLETKP